MGKSNLIGCGTCGYPLTPEERTALVEVGGVMVKPTAKPAPLTVNELRQMWLSRETGWGFYVAVNERVKALQDAAPHCTWTPDNDPNAPGTYHSACGVAWTFTEGGPADNDVRFCMGCGWAVQQAAGSNAPTQPV